MAHIVLIACASKKRERSAKARDLYLSALFTKSLAYAERLRPDRIYILSAKHGLIPSENVIAPYDETLNTKGTVEIRAWAEGVIQDLRQVTDLRSDRFTILAGDKYRRYLMPHITHADVPLVGLPIGKQLQRLDELCRT
jgi:hypothetical protein